MCPSKQLLLKVGRSVLSVCVSTSRHVTDYVASKFFRLNRDGKYTPCYFLRIDCLASSARCQAIIRQDPNLINRNQKIRSAVVLLRDLQKANQVGTDSRSSAAVSLCSKIRSFQRIRFSSHPVNISPARTPRSAASARSAPPGVRRDHEIEYHLHQGRKLCRGRRSPRMISQHSCSVYTNVYAIPDNYLAG